MRFCLVLLVILSIILIIKYNNVSGDMLGVPGCGRRAGISQEKDLSAILLPSLNIKYDSLVTLIPSLIKYNQNDKLQLKWNLNNNFNGCTDDFIGIYLESTDTTIVCDYLDFQYVNINNELSGIQEWLMQNIRSSLQFRYYSKQPCNQQQYTFITSTQSLIPNNLNEPTQIHISLTGTESEMNIHWITNSNSTLPQVQYGINPNNLDNTQIGISTTYAASSLCEGKANKTSGQTFINPGFMQNVKLTHLTFNTKYYYRVGNNNDGWSNMYSFVSSIPPNYSDTVKFIAIADMGVATVEPGANSTAFAIINRINKGDINFVLHAGDLSYARGIAVLWDRWMNLIQPIAAYVPYLVGIGNHEYDYVTDVHHNDPSGKENFRPYWGTYGSDSGGECAVPVVKRFSVPTKNGGNGVFWYSFDYGPVHILMFSTEHNFTIGSHQYRWIEKDLASVDRNKTPWIITASHRPMYATAQWTEFEWIKLHLQEIIEPLLYKYHVDVNIYGHLHSYERTCAMYKDNCIDSSLGTTHILLGNAGQNIDSNVYLTREWSIYRDEYYGYTTFTINSTHLHFQYFHNQENQLADQFILTK